MVTASDTLEEIDFDFRAQLEEAATIVAQRLSTCAFCGLHHDPANLVAAAHNPIHLCTACGVPTCRDCRLFLSISNEGATCRHAPRRAR